jgi:small subunit ribosomal protein S17
MENKKVNNKKLEGIVVSDKMQKSAVIEVQRTKRHPRYKKILKIKSRFKIHDENNEVKVGDWVLVEECRPMSKDKKWKLVSVFKKTEKENMNESINAEEK